MRRQAPFSLASASKRVCPGLGESARYWLTAHTHSMSCCSTHPHKAGGRVSRDALARQSGRLDLSSGGTPPGLIAGSVAASRGSESTAEML